MAIAPLAISALGSIASTLFGSSEADKQKQYGADLQRQGEVLDAQAWKGRTNLDNNGVYQTNYNRAQTELNDNQLQDAETAQANANAGYSITAQKRAATSGIQAILAAGNVQQQMDASKRQAAVDAANQRMAKLQNLTQAGQNLTNQNNVQWDANVNQPFLIKEQNAQDRIGLGINMQLGAMKSKANSWISGISALSGIAGSAASSGLFGGGGSAAKSGAGVAYGSDF